MLKYILFLLLSFTFLDAKSSVGACIPIGKVVILKKSIMTLKLSKIQKEKLYTYEQKLKDDLKSIKENAKSRNEGLSTLFDDKNFLEDKFTTITDKENKLVTIIISEYFRKMYKVLTKKQRVKLVKRFKRIERKRRKPHSK
jgi:Spy/CpxP family protein refolding chaperone